MEVESASGEQDAAAGEIGALEQHVRRLLGYFGRSATHHSRQRNGLLQVADDPLVPREDPLRVVQRGQPLAVRRLPDDDPWSGEPTHIEGMQRLAGLQHRVVGRVDHGVDRADPRGRQPCLNGERGGLMSDSTDHAGHVARTTLEIVDPHGHRIGDGIRHLVHRGLERHELHAGGGRRLPRDAVDAQEVGAVGFHLDVQDDLVQAQTSFEILADVEPSVVEDQDAAVVLTDRELARGAQHAVRVDPSDPAYREWFHEDGHARTRRRPRDQIPRHHVANPDHQLGLAGPVLDPGHAELVRVRVVAYLHDPSDDHTLEAIPRTFDRLDQHASRDQDLRESLGVQIRRRVLTEPAERNAHHAAPNRSRNRTSLSIRSRISGISYRRIATRSIPRPNANPVYRSLSYPQFSSTFGCTIPAPSSSIHPLPHVGQPAPSQRKQVTPIWAPGSTKGKYDGVNRIFRSSPNKPLAIASRVPLRSPNVIPSSTASASTWWKTARWVGSGVSRR